MHPKILGYSVLVQDLKELYSNHGFAVFLTFTYNNRNLPHTSFGFNGDVVECFNADHVSSFLNKIKGLHVPHLW